MRPPFSKRRPSHIPFYRRVDTANHSSPEGALADRLVRVLIHIIDQRRIFELRPIMLRVPFRAVLWINCVTRENWVEVRYP